jgi:hypothetical protein
MPNFAIPGKPEYDGENRTSLNTYGKWHIPFYTDDKPVAAVQAIVANASNATAAV